MEITEVRIKLMDDSDDRLQAFCSITVDGSFVIRDLKIIEGTNGPFVAMPSRKLTSHCPQCGAKNHLRSSYCNQCGNRLKEDRTFRDHEGRTKLYADIAHPINSECREMIQQHVIAEYQSELERARQPGYISRYDEGYEDPESDHVPEPESKQPSTERTQIQPGEIEPRPPHQPRSRASEQGPLEQRRDDKFGDGIFE